MSRAPPLLIERLSVDVATEKGDSPVLDQVSMEIRAGEVVGLIGESGSGKSTLALSIMQLLPKGAAWIRSGDIWFEGRSLRRLKPREMRRVRGSRIAFVPQNPMNALNPTIRVGHQVSSVLRQHHAMAADVAWARAEEMLTRLEFADASRVMQVYPHTLSGGMRQRVLLAMAFSCHPTLLIADEPTTALDSTVRAEILRIIKEVAQESETAVLFITHELGILKYLCKRVYVIYAGRLVEAGLTTSVLHAPKHPYTRALISCLPERGAPRERLPAIPGPAPKLGEFVHGCNFSPRCPYAHAACTAVPPWFAGHEHGAECWLLNSREQHPTPGYVE
jgi:oligopeptide/dipeptide ABC transporter ATP-binding protein